MTPFLRLFSALCVFLLVGPGPASAAPPPTPVATTTAAATVKPEELTKLLATLNDPMARDRLIADLQTLAKLQGQQPPPAADPDGIVAVVREQVDRVSEQVRETAAVMSQVPFVLTWFQRQVADEEIRTYWLVMFGKLAVVIAAALLAEWLIKRLLARQRFAFVKPGQSRRRFRVISFVARALIALLAIAGFTAVPIFILPFLSLDPVALHVALVGIKALVVTRLVMAIAHLAVVPHPPFLPLFDLRHELGQQISRWTYRVTGTLAYGVALAEATSLLGVPASVHALIIKVTSVTLAIQAMMIIHWLRHPVARLIRGRAREAVTIDETETNDPMPTTSRARDAWRDARTRFADDWHVPAMIYVAAVLVLSLFEVQGGLTFALRATVVSAVAVVAGQFTTRFLRGALTEEKVAGGWLGGHFPALSQRVNLYVPLLLATLTVLTHGIVLLTVLWAWGLDGFGLFATTAGREIASRLGSVVVILILALAAWEFANAAIERQLMGLETNTTAQRRSTRLQTLLPLLRNALMIAIVTVTALSALSALGINIAPLLAGAGVVGVAIGFGSQTLVKDMITGLFILLENSLAVGDVVDLGGGHAGVVEALSIRTIRLRDVSGSIHALPFSSVSTVINRSKDFAYHVFDQPIGFDANVETAVGVIKRVVDEMRADPALGSAILGGAEIFGIDELGTNGTLTIKGRIKTKPGQQWMIRYAFNSRLAKELPAAGIPFPGTVVAPTLAQEFAVLLERLRDAQTRPVETPPDGAKPA